MLNFHIVVNDAGELKTITPDDIKTVDALGEFALSFDQVINKVLDNRSAAEEQLDKWDDLVEQSGVKISDEPDPVLDPPAPVADPDVVAAAEGEPPAGDVANG